jgi:hypothetical protein
MGVEMKPVSKYLFALILLTGLPAQAAEIPYYKYAHDDAEYSVMLPEAPMVETIWADMADVPYLDDPPKTGALGEMATFRRVDIDTEDTFDVKITFLKATPVFVDGLTEESMKAALKSDLKDIRLQNAGFDFSTTKGNLKWATLSGFSVDENNHPFFNAEHYLTGEQSILVIKVQYSVENRAFGEHYKKLADNISYYAP